MGSVTRWLQGRTPAISSPEGIPGALIQGDNIPNGKGHVSTGRQITESPWDPALTQ